uniref:non-specific serine/threonine protein kinase n=1 Tax=Zea mays TaxID=4577 RepID=A0A0H4PB25_MAIZE|nr:wall-associated receptor-like kinase 2 [Zea mays]
MAAHLPRLPVLLLVLLAAHVVSTSAHGEPPLPSTYNTSAHGEPLLPSTYNASMCSESFWCGGVEIRYPFNLANATADYSGNYYSCGYTDLSVSCELEVEGSPTTWTPTIRLGGDIYTVKNISYDYHTISLADNDVLGGGECPVVRHNVSFNETWLHNASAFDNLTFFFGCHWGPRNTPPEFADYNISCAGFNPPTISGGDSFVFKPEYLDEQEEQELASHCDEVFSVPVRSDALRATFSLTGYGYGELLRQGFGLEWNRTSEDQCGQCEGSGSGGWCAYSQKREFLGCLCSGGKVGNPFCKPSKSTRKPRILAGALGGGAAALLVGAAIFLFVIMRKRKQKKKVTNSSSKLLKYSGSGGTPRSRVGDMESGSIEDPPTHHFAYEELEEATNRFDESRELGDGGFGTVYKGYLRDGRVVAVKRLYNNGYRRVEQFQNEAAILSGLRHPNLVMFYGCTSSHSRELLLVYEFVANGTVADHLHGQRAPERALSWPLRLSVAVESAAALTYLHAIEPPVVHRDVKTTNILLDADYHVKVADFGLSRLFPLDVTHVSTAPQGTPGYVDPEYHQCYQLTDKSDVYSFGVVLVELISSKPAVDITRHRSEINLASMAISKIQKCQLEELVDLGLGYDTDPATRKMMTMVAELAFRCLQQNGEMRPPIKEVLEVLRNIQGECLTSGKDGDKSKDGPFSPTTVHAPWDSRSTTPNTSRD